MRPGLLKTKIFLDSGDPAETKEALHLLGFLDGQTTNPSLIAKNPAASGKKFTKEEVLSFYRSVVQKVSDFIPHGSVSIEVYADKHSTVKELLSQGRDMFSWIPNAHIKFPTTAAGLEAAQRAIKERIRVNMTLCFSQEQAAAVYALTVGASRGNAFVSPFVGRLDDSGENGMDLVKNIIQMYKKGDGHVEVLAASLRTMEHLMYSLALGSEIITVPLKLLKEWKASGLALPSPDYRYNATALKPLPYKELNLSQDWKQFNSSHPLTDKGLEKFAEDWQGLISNS